MNCGKINFQKAKLERLVMEEELEPRDTKAVDAKDEAPEESSPQQDTSSSNGQFKSNLRFQLTL